MKIVLLSGGQGKRLWPVSLDKKPKQFISFFDEGTSMLKSTFNKVSSIFGASNVFVATHKDFKKEVRKEIKNFDNIILENETIGTFGAIVNLSIYLKYKCSCDDNEIVAVVPIDHDIDEFFYNILKNAEERLNESNNSICLIGIKPTYPSTSYGYIIHKDGKVLSFKEKPDKQTAIKYIKKCALWNSGIVVFRLKRIIDISKKYIDYNSYEEFQNKYNFLPHISFDYEVLEKENDLLIVESEIAWSDIGLWENLAPKISKSDKYNTNIINYENKKIINDGVENIILINTKDGIRIIPKINDNRK